MLGLKLNHVSKRGHWCVLLWFGTSQFHLYFQGYFTGDLGQPRDRPIIDNIIVFQHLLRVYKKENIKYQVHITGPFWGESISLLAIGEGNPMVTVEYPRPRASNAEIVSRLWHLHVNVFVSLKWRDDVTPFCHRIVSKLCHQLENYGGHNNMALVDNKQRLSTIHLSDLYQIRFSNNYAIMLGHHWYKPVYFIKMVTGAWSQGARPSTTTMLSRMRLFCHRNHIAQHAHHFTAIKPHDIGSGNCSVCCYMRVFLVRAISHYAYISLGALEF